MCIRGRFNMNLTMHLDLTAHLFSSIIQGLIFIVAAVYVLLSISRAKRTGQATHLRWLVPLAIYVVDEAITYAIDNFYSLLGSSQPEPLNTITDVMDDVAQLAFLWALIVLWRMIRSKPELLQTPWLSRGATPEGVWPPAPEA